MDNDSDKVKVSQLEISLLVKTLTKTVELLQARRRVWLVAIAGLVAGVCLAAAVIPLWKPAPQKEAVCREILKQYAAINLNLQKESEALNLKLQKIGRQVEKLALLKASGPEKKLEKLLKDKLRPAKIFKPTALEKNRSLKEKPKREPEPLKFSAYTVVIHYARQDDQKLIAGLADYLKAQGYQVPRIQKVNYHNGCNIRFFHSRDKKMAVFLKKQVTGHIIKQAGLPGIDIKTVNLQAAYPDVPLGLLEVWINF